MRAEALGLEANGGVLADTDPDLEVDYTQYEPPEALNKLPSIASEILIAIVNSSLENIRNQIAAEKDRRKQEEEAAQRAAAATEAEAEAEAAEGKGKAKATDGDGGATGEQPEIPRLVLPRPEPGKRHKRSRFGISRMLRHVMMDGSKGETSAAGAARHYSEGSSDLAAPNFSTSFLHIGHKKPKELEPPVDTVECISCFDDVPTKQTIATPCHNYCKECFERLISATVDDESRWPMKCCLNEIPVKTITKNISSDLLKRYKEKAEEFKVAIDSRVYCSEPDCGLFIKRDLISMAQKTARCGRGHQICLICRQPAHPADATCPQDRDQQLADNLAELEGWKRCYKCKLLIEHREACQHMTCRCGAEFCYVCGARWRTCSCTMDQLRAYKDAAQARHAARTEQEEAEERELQEALRQVAEFEREEALKAELQRVQRARIAEERRRREAEERRRREEERHAEMEKKHAELTATLAKLNDVQRMVLTYTHDREREAARKKATDARAELVAKQEAERTESRAATAAKIAEVEHGWDQDYVARLIWEQRLEEEYREQLREFWARRRDGGRRASEALREYMKRNDGRFDAYNRWRDGELEKFRYHAEDEQGIKEELMEATLQRLDEMFSSQEVELKKRLKAERRWFEVVMAERARLLEELKTVERENGGESDGGTTSDGEDEFFDSES